MSPEPTPDPDPDPDPSTVAGIKVTANSVSPYTGLTGWFCTTTSPWDSQVSGTSKTFNDPGAYHDYTLEPGNYYFFVAVSVNSDPGYVSGPTPGNSGNYYWTHKTKTVDGNTYHGYLSKVMTLAAGVSTYTVTINTASGSKKDGVEDDSSKLEY